MKIFVVAYQHGNAYGSTQIEAMDRQSALDNFIAWFGETTKFLAAWVDHEVNQD